MNNYTTIYLVSALIDRGLTDTADAFWNGHGVSLFTDQEMHKPFNERTTNRSTDCICPLWSVSALLQICTLASVNGGVEKMIKHLATVAGLSLYRRLFNMPEFIITYIQDHPYDFDFSKIRKL